MILVDAANGLVVSHTPAPRKRMFEDLETAAQAMRAQEAEQAMEQATERAIDHATVSQPVPVKRARPALKNAGRHLG